MIHPPIHPSNCRCGYHCESCMKDPAAFGIVTCQYPGGPHPTSVPVRTSEELTAEEQAFRETLGMITKICNQCDAEDKQYCSFDRMFTCSRNKLIRNREAVCPMEKWTTIGTDNMLSTPPQTSDSG